MCKVLLNCPSLARNNKHHKCSVANVGLAWCSCDFSGGVLRSATAAAHHGTHHSERAQWGIWRCCGGRARPAVGPRDEQCKVRKRIDETVCQDKSDCCCSSISKALACILCAEALDWLTWTHTKPSNVYTHAQARQRSHPPPLELLHRCRGAAPHRCCPPLIRRTCWLAQGAGQWSVATHLARSREGLDRRSCVCPSGSG